MAAQPSKPPLFRPLKTSSKSRGPRSSAWRFESAKMNQTRKNLEHPSTRCRIWIGKIEVRLGKDQADIDGADFQATVRKPTGQT